MKKEDETEESEVDSKWLDAHYDPVASLYTFTQCITLSDINADGEYKLIIADLGSGGYNMKLKVYKGTALVTEHTIIDLPTGIVAFYMDTNEPRTPAIAVASGPHIYIYKNLRPYFKFTLPSLEINQVEQDLWNQAKHNIIDPVVLREMLEGIKMEGATLTVRSLHYVQLNAGALEEFASIHKSSLLKRQTVITCLTTLKKNMTEDDAVSCLVLGTESKNIFILDPEAFTVLAMLDMPAVPVFLDVSGLFDVEYRIIVACRDAKIYTLKRGVKMGKLSIDLNSQPVGLVRVGKNIVVGCMDSTLQGFSTKGKNLWKLKLPASITTMELMDLKQRSFKAVIVALSNCEVRIFKDKYHISTIITEDVVTGLRYGRFGREDASLIMTTKGGGLVVKIMKRTATFEEHDTVMGPPISQSQKLNVPKKTKLFVDQTMRERENSVSMHRQFQHDLYRLRLEAARNYVKSLRTIMNPISTSPEDPLKMAAAVRGIGPSFKLTVNLQNTSLSTPSTNLIITFNFNNKLYSVQYSVMHVPMLVPGLNYAFETLIQCLSDKGISDNIMVFVSKKGRTVPIITANISMPVSETIVVV